MSQAEISTINKCFGNSDDTLAAQAFDQASMLPPNLQSSSAIVSSFAGRYMSIPGDSLEGAWFQWDAFKQAVNDYNGEKICFDFYDKTTINKNQNQVSVMVDSIVQYLKGCLRITLSDEIIQQISTKVATTFDNLSESSSRGFLSFSYEDTRENSSWQYRIVFSVPNDQTSSDKQSSDWFYSLVATIKLTAKIKDKGQWFGLIKESSSEFSAEISAMRLFVHKDFSLGSPKK